jgi:hypothetical protein
LLIGVIIDWGKDGHKRLWHKVVAVAVGEQCAIGFFLVVKNGRSYASIDGILSLTNVVCHMCQIGKTQYSSWFDGFFLKKSEGTKKLPCAISLLIL